MTEPITGRKDRTWLYVGLVFAIFWGAYLAFFGPAKQVTTLQMMTDGTSNTVAVVEARNAVPWTKPDDLPFDPNANAPLLGAGSPHPGGFNALFADGSVRFLKSTIDLQTLKALITTNGTEVIAPGKF